VAKCARPGSIAHLRDSPVATSPSATGPTRHALAGFAGTQPPTATARRHRSARKFR
jgi:hypothetical protein